MDAQIFDRSVWSQSQKKAFEEEGWRYSERGIESEIQKLNLESIKKEIMSQNQESIIIQSTYNQLKKMQAKGEKLTAGELRLVKEQDAKYEREGRHIYDYTTRKFKWQPPKRPAEQVQPQQTKAVDIEDSLKQKTAALFLNRTLAKVVNEVVDDDWAEKGKEK